MEFLKAVLFGIVQGITEWLPISSTGHMILLDQLAPLNLSKEFVETFLVVIQLGSILAVAVLFFEKLNPFSRNKSRLQKRDTYALWSKVLVAVLPAGVIGILFDDKIDALFYNPTTVATTLILYGILFIGLESRHREPSIRSFNDLSYRTALWIGFFQVLALIPGTSRSGATILGAVFLGASRYIASEFSFFLAIPVMFGASLIKLLKAGFGFSGLEWGVLAVGSLTAFIVSLFAIKFLLAYIRKHDFKAFGYYRILLGATVLGYFFLVK